MKQNSSHFQLLQRTREAWPKPPLGRGRDKNELWGGSAPLEYGDFAEVFGNLSEVKKYEIEAS